MTVQFVDRVPQKARGFKEHLSRGRIPIAVAAAIPAAMTITITMVAAALAVAAIPAAMVAAAAAAAATSEGGMQLPVRDTAVPGRSGRAMAKRKYLLIILNLGIADPPGGLLGAAAGFARGGGGVAPRAMDGP